MSRQPRDITIIGSGIVGCCCALALLERGHRVRLIDRLDPGEGTTRGSAGVVSPWSCVPQALPGVWRGVPGWLLDPDGPVRVRWRDLATVLPWSVRFLANARPARVARISDAMAALIRDCITEYRGWLSDPQVLRDSLFLNVYRNGECPDENAWPWRLRRERGASIDYIGARELAELEPALAATCSGAMVVRDQARAASPGALCRALAEAAALRGATFERDSVQRIEPLPGGGFRLHGAARTSRCDTLVLAAGVTAAALLEPLGTRLPLIAERGYHVQYPDPGVHLHHSVMDMAGKYVASSMPDGLRVAGMAEFAAHRAHAAKPDPSRARALDRALQRLLPDVRSDGAIDWMGSRPSFPDNLPAIGALPSLPGLLCAFGHSHYGLSMAPGTGRAIACLVDGVAAPFDLAPYDPGRFA